MISILTKIIEIMIFPIIKEPYGIQDQASIVNEVALAFHSRCSPSTFDKGTQRSVDTRSFRSVASLSTKIPPFRWDFS